MKSTTAITLSIFTIATIHYCNADSDTSEFFILKFQNGTEINQPLNTFEKILKSVESELDQLPNVNAIVAKGNKEIDDVGKRMKAEGKNGVEISRVLTNIFYNTYEKMFAEAGMELKIYNPNPLFFP